MVRNSRNRSLRKKDNEKPRAPFSLFSLLEATPPSFRKLGPCLYIYIYIPLKISTVTLGKRRGRGKGGISLFRSLDAVSKHNTSPLPSRTWRELISASETRPVHIAEFLFYLIHRKQTVFRATWPETRGSRGHEEEIHSFNPASPNFCAQFSTEKSKCAKRRSSEGEASDYSRSQNPLFFSSFVATIMLHYSIFVFFIAVHERIRYLVRLFFFSTSRKFS